MPRKPNPPRDDEEQAKRFVETAKLLKADETEKSFKAAFSAAATTSLAVGTSNSKVQPKPKRSAQYHS